MSNFNSEFCRVLAYLDSFLSYQDLSCVSRSCRGFFDVIRGNDFLWKQFNDPFTRCTLQLSGSPPYDSQFDRFSRLLVYYGFLLNPLSANLPPSSEGVFWVEAAAQDPRGVALLWRWKEPKGVLEAFALPDSDPLFRIHPANWELSCKQHVATPVIEITDVGRLFLSSRRRYFLAEAPTITIANRQPEDPARQPSGHLFRENAITIGPLVFYPRIIVKRESVRHPLEGLWTAEYSTHGLEVLHFSFSTAEEMSTSVTDNRGHKDDIAGATYSNYPSAPFFFEVPTPDMENGSRLVAHKCTGDWNIFTDTDSFVIQLDRLVSPMPIEIAMQQARTTGSQSWSNWSYPIRLAVYFPMMLAESGENLADLVISAIHPGYGRVAQHGMLGASWIPILLYTFQNDTRIAIDWQLRRHSLHFYTRVAL